jgi:hypothetical protein
MGNDEFPHVTAGTAIVDARISLNAFNLSAPNPLLAPVVGGFTVGWPSIAPIASNASDENR